MRARWMMAASAVLVAGCTNYVPVPQDGVNWAEAKRAAYGTAAAPTAVAAASPPASAWPAPSPNPPPAAAWGEPAAEASGALDPKPLPPLDGRSTTSSRDAPVVTSAPSPATAAAPTRVVVAPPAAEPAPSVAERAPQVAEPATSVAAAPTPEVPAAVERAREQRSTGAATARAADPSPEVGEPLPPPALSGVGFLWPVPSLADTASVRAAGGDGGLIIDAGAGDPFVAAENGVVVFAADALETFGNMVVVRHDGDYTTAYAHAESLAVDVGDVVRRGQRLGLVGDTGTAAAPQLYFEMRVGSQVVDPRAYLVGTPQLAMR